MDRKKEQKIRDKYKKLTKILVQKGISITTMESITSGQVASLITDTEGSSAIFKGALVSYSNDAKIMLGVPAEVIEKYSVYSKETAAAMAAVCKKVFSADIGIGITGTAGNVDPANIKDSNPGNVFYAIAYGDSTVCYHLNINSSSSRLECKLDIADAVCESVNSIIAD